MRLKNPFFVFAIGLSSICLVLLFQNCGDINLLKLTSERPPPEAPEVPDIPDVPDIGDDGNGKPTVYDCVVNGTVPDGHDGLTLANRMTLGYDHSGHRYPTHPLFFDLTQYNSIVRFPTTAGGGAYNLVAPGPLTEGYGFPGSADMRNQINVEPGKFIALKFRVPNDPSWHGIRGSVSFFPAHDTPNNPENYIDTNTGVSWTISKCPGQFRNVASAPPLRNNDCTSWTGESTYTDARLMWIIEDPTRPYQRSNGTFRDRCPLTPGETYYINFIPFVDANVPGSLDPKRVSANYTGHPNFPDSVPSFFSLRFMNDTGSRDHAYATGN